MDALRYSMLDPGGTARFASMGGAFGALGGDFSSLGINPAGLGIYRSSEVTITPSLSYQAVETGYFGQVSEDMKYNVNLNNIGLVFSVPLSRNMEVNAWRFVNFGFGLNRQNNFNNRWIAEGFNNQNSLMTSFLEQAIQAGHENNLDDFSTGLAWDTYLLDKYNDVFFVDMPDGNVLQRQSVNSSGSLREYVFSMAANYNDRLYLGGTVGLPVVRYQEEVVFEERDVDGISEYFNALTFRNQFETRGSGLNLKVGAIVRPVDFLRLGLAIHTPTFYSLKDTFSASMQSDLNLDYDTDYAISPVGEFEYELNTPMKAIGSLAFVFGTNGLLSLDYEYVDYTTSRLRSSDYSFSEENSVIRNNMQAQHVLRLGGEIRLAPLALRAGYGYYSSPYREGVNDASRSVLSAGIGFRERSFFMDFGYTYSFHSEEYALYMLENPSMIPVAERDFTASIFRITMGWRF